MRRPSWFVLLLFIITCSACSTLSQKIHPTTIQSKTADSEILLSALSHRNDSLRTFKGTGKVNIVKEMHPGVSICIGSSMKEFMTFKSSSLSLIEYQGDIVYVAYKKLDFPIDKMREELSLKESTT